MQYIARKYNVESTKLERLWIIQVRVRAIMVKGIENISRYSSFEIDQGY